MEQVTIYLKDNFEVNNMATFTIRRAMRRRTDTGIPVQSRHH